MEVYKHAGTNKSIGSKYFHHFLGVFEYFVLGVELNLAILITTRGFLEAKMNDKTDTLDVFHQDSQIYLQAHHIKT